VAAARAPRHPLHPLWLAALVPIAIAWSVTAWLAARPARPTSHTPPPPTLLELQHLAELVTARVTIADVHETRLAGYLGDIKAVLIVRGEALVGPDLSQARIIGSDDAQRRIVVELPCPHVISCQLDHSGTRIVCLTHDGLWVIMPGDAGRTVVLNRAYAEAERALARAAATPQTIEQAKTQAEAVLSTLFRAAGRESRVRWAR
jgi:hypothetical protein